MTVAGVVAGSLSVLLEEAGVVHRTQLADENGFSLLVEFGVGGHGSETRSMGLSRITIRRLECRFDFLRSLSSVVTR